MLPKSVGTAALRYVYAFGCGRSEERAVWDVFSAETDTGGGLGQQAPLCLEGKAMG